MELMFTAQKQTFDAPECAKRRKPKLSGRYHCLFSFKTPHSAALSMLFEAAKGYQ